MPGHSALPAYALNPTGNLTWVCARQAASPGGSAEDKWRRFFADSTRYWDNRFGKRNERAPDFKHKDSGEALWINDRCARPLSRPRAF